MEGFLIIDSDDQTERDQRTAKKSWRLKQNVWDTLRVRDLKEIFTNSYTDVIGKYIIVFNS